MLSFGGGSCGASIMSAFRPCLGEEERRKEEAELRLRVAEKFCGSSDAEYAHRQFLRPFD